jgi:hypothetical protein
MHESPKSPRAGQHNFISAREPMWPEKPAGFNFNSLAFLGFEITGLAWPLQKPDESPLAGWARFEHWAHFSLIDSRLSPSLFSVSKSIHAHSSPHIATPGVAIVLRGNHVYIL